MPRNFLPTGSATSFPPSHHAFCFLSCAPRVRNSERLRCSGSSAYFGRVIIKRGFFSIANRSLDLSAAMRMSCNGCRVLRKGCSDSCTIRPCLEWIKTAESQANATVFLAKFYGRAGLMNLVNAAPQHLRPAVFRSLLYEACGRIVNPTYGSVGLLWSGNWQICQAAVECILKGCPIRPVSHSEVRGSSPRSALLDTIARELHKVKSRSRFKAAKKAAGVPAGSRRELAADDVAAPQVCNLRGRRCYPGELAEPAAAEPPANVVSSDSCSESGEDPRSTPAADSAEIASSDECRRFSTWKRSGVEGDVAPAEGLSSDDVEVELELRLGSPGSSDHEKLMSAQCHWSPVASCLDLALTPPS